MTSFQSIFLQKKQKGDFEENKIDKPFVFWNYKDSKGEGCVYKEIT